jgi:choice-of-anchor A domain-containing protein
LSRRSQRLFTAAIALSLSGAAQATSVFDYNVVAFGNFTSANTEVMGALAVGRDATISNYGVGVSLPPNYDGESLVVGNNLTVNASNLFHGAAVIGGQISSSGLSTERPGAINTGAAVLPIDFSSELVRVKELSANLAGLESNGSVTQTWRLEFTGADASMNVFNITADQLGGSNGFSVNIPTGSIAVFNVSGSSLTTNWPGSFILNGQTISNSVSDLASPLLFNFSDANSLTFNGSWAGSVLAPKADVQLNWGGFFGTLIANNVTSSSEIYNVRLNEERLPLAPQGNIPPIPEPSTWAMLVGGLLAVGTVLRRRKAPVAFA